MASDAPTAPRAEVAPADPAMIAWLTECLASILRCGPVAAGDNFFDLGGDSMSAVALFAAIEAAFGRVLPLTLIYDAPVVRDLAAVIGAADAALMAVPEPAAILLPIKPGAARQGVFIIHGVGGHVFDLQQLGARLDTQATVFALRAPGLEPSETPLNRVESMAEAYAQAIRAAQPGGDYALIGYSFGGLIALETATRLRAAGGAVGPVILLDTYPCPRHWRRAQRADVRLRRIFHQSRELWAANWPARTAYVRARIMAGLGAVRRGPAGAASRGRWLRAPDYTTPELQRVFDAAAEALQQYDPLPADGRVVFIKPQVPAVFLPANPAAVWRRLIPGLVVRETPGDHVTMLDSHAPALAALVSAYLHGAHGVANSDDAG